MTIAKELETYVIPTEFEYIKPKSLNEALMFLTQHKNVKVLAGGTDIVLGLKTGKAECEYLLDLKALNELSFIKEESNAISIGAITTVDELLQSAIIKTKFKALYQAAKDFGSPAVRNMATIGGNICNASPAADLVVALLALDAKLKLISKSGERTIPISEFFTGPGTTVLRNDELLSEVNIPYLPDGAKSVFSNIKRTSISASTVNLAIALDMDKDERIKLARIALGAVAPTPLRIYDAEKYLTGKILSDQAILDTSKIVKDNVKPITDVRGTAEYRRHASGALVELALKKIKRGEI